MTVTPHEKEPALYALLDALGLAHHTEEHRAKRLSFGKPDALLDLLGVVPGSVTVFSVLNDTEQKVRLILDKALFTHDYRQ